MGCFVVAAGVKLGAGVGVGESHAGRRVQEQDVRRCSNTVYTRTKLNLDNQRIINKLRTDGNNGAHQCSTGCR